MEGDYEDYIRGGDNILPHWLLPNLITKRAPVALIFLSSTNIMYRDNDPNIRGVNNNNNKAT